VRFRRAIARIRHAMRARLRWRPSPPIPDTTEPDRIEGTTKLRVYSPGMRRGAVVRG